MVAEKLYNDFLNKITESAKGFAEGIYLMKTKGKAKIENYFEINPYDDYGVDMANVIIWGGDYNYDGVCAKSFNVETISFDGMNIVLFNEDGDDVRFTELPANSMVFVCNCLEEIANKERENNK